MPRPMFKNGRQDPAAPSSKTDPTAMTEPDANAEPARGAPRLTARGLSHRKPTRFDWRPEAEARAALAAALDLPAITALRLKGEILPEGRDDFRLTARLEAEVVQACVITLAPVPARIAEEVQRRYLADWAEPDGEEVEIPAEDAEALPEVIDIAEVTREALALALPPYPRAPGAELGEQVFAAEGEAPLRDQDLRPFAGLAALMQPVLKGDAPDENNGSQGGGS